MPGQLKKNTSELTMTSQSLNTQLCVSARVCVFLLVPSVCVCVCEWVWSVGETPHSTWGMTLAVGRALEDDHISFPLLWTSPRQWHRLYLRATCQVAAAAAAVSVIPFWLRQRGWLFLCQASAACTPGSWYSEQKPGDLHNSLQSLWNGEATQVSRA